MKKQWLNWLVMTSLFASPALAQNKTDQNWIDFTGATEVSWNKFTEWKESATNQLVVYPPDSNRALFALYEGGIDPNSMLAAFILHSGGMLVDHGWIRVLGSGCPELMRGFKDWNAGKNKPAKDGFYYLLIADDVVGGFFALKMGPGVELDKAKVWYYGSSNLHWTNTGIDYPAFLRFCMAGNLNGFYYDYRWKGWEQEVVHFSQRHTIGCYPLLWTVDGKEVVSNRKVLDVATLWNKYQNRK